jgi:hypothetical protein
MHRFQRDMWKAGIAVAGLLLLLVCMVWFPVSAGANESATGFTTPVITVQATPTVDVTVAALNKEQLTLQVKQLQDQNSWLVNNSTALIAAFTTLVVALFGISQWAVNRRDERRKELEAQDKESKDRQVAQDKELEDRKAERERRDEEQKRWLKNQEAEREKRAEERFQAVVEGLGSTNLTAQVGAAIMLRTFLRPGYEQFYSQVFDLCVVYLRLPRMSHPPEDLHTPLPLTTLSQALITVFKESFPLARDEWINSRKDEPFDPRSLDATGTQLDNAYLREADLKQAWLRQASLRNVDLRGADLRKANLRHADLREVYPREADLRGADLFEANLSGADLRKARLEGANLKRANIEEAGLLEETNLRGVKGLTKEQLKACKAKGAIIDEDAMISLSQPPVSTPEPPSRNYIQAPSTQKRTPLSNADGSSATSSKPSPES